MLTAARLTSEAIAARLSGDEPRVASLIPVWSGANWMEREAFDITLEPKETNIAGIHHAATGRFVLEPKTQTWQRD